jgi:hypothetical protein
MAPIFPLATTLLDTERNGVLTSFRPFFQARESKVTTALNDTGTTGGPPARGGARTDLRQAEARGKDIREKPIHMAQAADLTGGYATPTAPTPTVAAPVCDDFSVRIIRSATEHGATGRERRGQWVGRLRRISAGKLHAWGLSPLVDDATLLISEVVTNALQHNLDGEIEFRLVITLQGLLIMVNDGTHHRP